MQHQSNHPLETCDICHQQIVPNEPMINSGGEIAHTACIRDWFRRNYGREGLSS